MTQKHSGPQAVDLSVTRFHTTDIGGLKVFYREAGDPSKPTLVLLHGFPSASHQYQGLFDRLAGDFHLIAPDYPGFGHSDQPSPADFPYTFDRYADVVERVLEAAQVSRYALYMQDYGGPVGMRLALRRPDLVTGLVVQNATFYTEAITSAFDPVQALWADRTADTEAALAGFFFQETTTFQHLHGARDASRVSPDTINLDQLTLDRPGNHAIQLDLMFDYQHNMPLYARFQALLRGGRLPVLAVWGQNDPFFSTEGATLLRRDVPEARVVLLDGGHFALDEYADEVAAEVRTFLTTHAV